MLSYILWDTSADLFTWGQFTLRWNGVLLILTFVVGRLALGYMYRKEGKPASDVDVITAFVVAGIVVGARIGHVILYQPELWSTPLAILFPFDFKPSFHFTGMSGFSSTGGALGMFAALWLYSLKKRQDQSYLQVLDRTTLVALWIVVPSLLSSFLHSEVEGKPTNSDFGTVFVQPVSSGLEKLSCCIMRNPGGRNPLSSVLISRGKDAAIREGGHHTLALYLFFKKDTPMQMVDEFMLGDVKTYLYEQSKFIYEPGTEPLHYAVFKEPNGDFDVRVRTRGVAHYPVQLFEAASSLILLAVLLMYWNRYKNKLPAGRIFGLGMILFWSLRFGWEFLREDQTRLISGIALNQIQMISIPLILAGLAALILSFRKTSH